MSVPNSRGWSEPPFLFQVGLDPAYVLDLTDTGTVWKRDVQFVQTIWGAKRRLQDTGWCKLTFRGQLLASPVNRPTEYASVNRTS